MQLSWNKLINSECYKDNFKKTEARSPFVRDVDRVTFSNHFKRLMRKTQVHPLSGNDHVHNRLLHSLEVASVGRSIACKVYQKLKKMEMLPVDNMYEFASIVQAACLAHDLGNPPFGHSGESAIKEWFSRQDDLKAELSEHYTDFTRYDGNASSFRIVTGRPGNINTGIKLTYSSIGAMVKYPWFSASHEADKGKFSFFHANKKAASEVMTELGCCKDGIFIRHPLSYLAEAADDICYCLLDIEDAYEMKIIDKPTVLNFYSSTYGVRDTDVSHARSRLIGQWIDKVCDNFFDQYEALMNGGNVYITNNVDAASAKKFAREHIYYDERTAHMMIGSYHTYELLLGTFVLAIMNNFKGKAGHKDHYTVKLMERSFLPDNYAKMSLYEQVMLAVDYITGMTDNYISETASYFMGAADTGRRW